MGVLLKRLNIGSHKQHQTIAWELSLVFWCQKSQQNLGGVTPPTVAKCRWGRLNAGAVAAHWRLSTQSVVNLVQSLVYDTEQLICLQHVRRDAGHHMGLSARADPCIVHYGILDSFMLLSHSVFCCLILFSVADLQSKSTYMHTYSYIVPIHCTALRCMK